MPFATKFGTALGALSGCLVAIVIAYWDLITGQSPLSFQWISLISLIVNLIVGCGVSWIQTGGKPQARPPFGGFPVVDVAGKAGRAVRPPE